MTRGIDGAVDSFLVDPPALSRLSRPGGFFAPLLIFLLGEQLIKQAAVFRRKLLDANENVVNGCAAHAIFPS